MQNGVYTVVYVSTAINKDKCGWGALVSLNNVERVILHGQVPKKTAPAFAIYAELEAIDKAVDTLLDNGISSARIMLEQDKAMNALTRKEIIHGCVSIADKIRDKIKGKNYTFSLTEFKPNSISAVIACRAAEIFPFKNYNRDIIHSGVKDYDSELLFFTIREFYTRKTHQEYEYLNLAMMFEQYHGPKNNVSVPLEIRKIIDGRYKSTPEKRDIACAWYLAGLTAEDAIHTTALQTSFEDLEHLHSTYMKELRKMVMDKDRNNHRNMLTDQEINLVAEITAKEYLAGKHLLRTLEESVLDVYLAYTAQKNGPQRIANLAEKRENKKKKIIITGENASKAGRFCSVCGSKVDGNGLYCTNSIIANIVSKNGNNFFCSLECFGKAAGIKEAG